MSDKRKIAVEEVGCVADEDRITHEQKKQEHSAELTHREKKYLERVHGHNQKMHEPKLDRERQAMRSAPRMQKVMRKGVR